MDHQEIFSNLPSETILNILSRVPIKTVFACKYVCKSWLDLLGTPEFIRSHLSKSVPVLFIHRAIEPNVFTIVEFEDSLEVEHLELHSKTVLELDVEQNINLSYGLGTRIEGSANGLLFLRNRLISSRGHYVCNPITREYIKLPEPEWIKLYYPTDLSYGFGVSRLSCHYKVVRLFDDRLPDPVTGLSSSIPKYVCQVYTLGTGSWRRMGTPSGMLLNYDFSTFGKLLNGNLHWLAMDLKRSWWISCFDLETEVFTKFRTPLVESEGVELGVLRDRLCLCDNSPECVVSIYLMNDYGDDTKSWNKEYVISELPDFAGEPYDEVYVVNAFGGGDLLLAVQNFYLFCYSNRTKTTTPVAVNGDVITGYVRAMLYTPSFISLKDFKTEDAKGFGFVCSMI